jgi:hypothetical protein
MTTEADSFATIQALEAEAIGQERAVLNPDGLLRLELEWAQRARGMLTQEQFDFLLVCLELELRGRQ